MDLRVYRLAPPGGHVTSTILEGPGTESRAVVLCVQWVLVSGGTGSRLADVLLEVNAFQKNLPSPSCPSSLSKTRSKSGCCRGLEPKDLKISLCFLSFKTLRIETLTYNG